MHCSIVYDLFDNLVGKRQEKLGIISPSAFAVLRLTTTSNFVGYCTGRSVGAGPPE